MPGTSLPGDVHGLAFDGNSNTLYGTDTMTNDLITIDPATGMMDTLVGSTGNSMPGLTFR